MESTDIATRRTTSDDVDAIMALAGRSLGWEGDERDRAFFRWKHLENPFGTSPGWVACDGDGIIAFRTLLRWQLVRGEERLRVVRAVDTATHPDHQGRGLFRRLTTEAVESLTAEGVDAIFNTPNDQSRPGYLKMGWSQLGRPTLMVHPSSPVAAIRMLSARVPAEKWSLPVTLGSPVTEVLDDLEPSANAVGSGRWTTHRTSTYLAWRYGFEPLRYRAIEVAGGHAIFRVRGRGGLREVALVEWLSERRDLRAVRGLVRDAGDYVVGLGLSPKLGFLPVPRQGPIVTWRPLARAEVPELPDLGFTLGDLELL